MTYKLWNKVSPIYDITAEQAMINNPLYGTESSYLSSSATEGEIYCCYILHKHSITDFAFRANLPVKDEHLVEQDKNFWEYLDSFNK